MKHWKLSILSGTTFTGVLILWAFIDHVRREGHSSPPRILMWLLDLGAGRICNYLNPGMENENLVCGVPMLIIDVTIYSIIFYVIFWLIGKIKSRDQHVVSEGEI